LKVYGAGFSTGQKGEIELKRIEHQVALGDHGCPSLVRVYEGGNFDGRLYLLMSRAPGKELLGLLRVVPRNKIRHIVDQVARAALFLKDKELCHRDIKAANIFVTEDFDRVTLLDISVIRNIYDPIGSGTDYEGQLPVVATARYSPPEYLFRLLEPGPDLWHALSVYQRGGLLHDLIMRKPLFESEFLKCTDNRYRFAWIVATVDAKVQADDVDQDLVFTACRALDKDWKRRSTLTLGDFLGDPKVQQAHALQFLGLADGSVPIVGGEDIAARLKLVREVSTDLQVAFEQFLRKNRVTATHDIRPGQNDTSKVLSFRWDAPMSESEANPRRIEFRLELQLQSRLGSCRFRLLARLSTLTAGMEREACMEVPEVANEPGVVSVLATLSESAFRELAVQILEAGVAVQEVQGHVTLVG
jgi:hypothetical protein